MTIINIRGTSGSGKSTLVHRLLSEYENYPMERKLGDWKKPKIIGYMVKTPGLWTMVVGRYETQCGGCDSMSYKGSHQDIENLVREFALSGNVIFEGLTISSTVSRWQGISNDFPGRFIWAFMMTPEEECYRRIIARSGREPKRNAKGLADYNIKYRGCMRHLETLKESTEQTLELTSDDEGYAKLLRALKIDAPAPAF